METAVKVKSPLEATFAESVFGLITGSTCGDACWHAREEICRCSCGGRNHGCLNHGAERPQRTARIGGEMYELAGIIPYPEGECYAVASERVSIEEGRIIDERFPGLDSWQYGSWREYKNMPVLNRKVSETQQNWAEVKAVPGAFRLIWARPVGSKYAKKVKDNQE